MISSGRWIGVGAAVLSVGALFVITWIVSSGHQSFWSWEGTLGTVLSGVGILMMATGFFLPDETSAPKLEQHGGANSTNYQAGRDIRLREDK
jgi:hypothetical protein